MTNLSKLMLGFTITKFAVKKNMERLANVRNARSTYLPTKTTLIMPTLNEEKYISKALNSIFNQNAIKQNPSKFEVLVVDSNSTDNTVEKALRFPVKVMYAERGLLNARDVANNRATGDIIVMVQADCVYPVNWLNLILRHFKDPEVVAVSGPQIHQGIYGYLLPQMAFMGWWERHHRRPIMYGNNSAFRKSLYPFVRFNLDINQLIGDELEEEEEHAFAERLSDYGKVVFDWQSVIFISPRRLLRFLDPKFSGEIKNKTRFGKLITVGG